ncbi:MAG TPA: SMC family ATPase [Acidimicrobiia bacterium]
MRLLALEMQGFGAFRSPTKLSFDDADFFALVGPTGSGKSTILDAVCFALYGSVPRYESENLIRYVVTLGALEARVRLDFELDGERYIATRVARRNNKGVVSTKEARLERVIEGDSTEVVAGFEREMSAAVVRLLGLRFDDFTRCVALPQGDFARFLRAKGDERRDLLLRLLNLNVYTEVGATARRLEAEARSQIGLIDSELRRYAAATPDALEAARSRQVRLAELTSEVEAAQPVLADLAAKQQAALGRANEAAEWVQRLQSIAVPESIRTFAERHREAQAALDGATAALTEAGAARKAALSARQPLPDLAELRATRRAHDELAQCIAAIESAEATHKEQADAETRLQAVFASAGTAAREAAEALEALRRQHLAHSLTETLVPGEPCPVCEQTVQRLPDRAPVAAVADAKRLVDEREQALARSRAEHTAIEKQLAGTTARLETLGDQRAKLAGPVEAHPDVAALDTLIGQVAEAENAVKQAQAAETDALEGVETAKAAMAQLDTAAQRARNEFTEQRDTVAALAPPPAGNRDVLTDWEALAAWAQALVPSQQKAADDERAAAEAHARTRAEMLSKLHTALEAVGVRLPGGADIMAIVSAAASAATGAAHTVAEIETAMEQAEKLRETRAGLEEDADVAKLLGQLLRADRFPEWLVAEALGVLTVDASEILRQLTGDQFSLAVGEKEFVVIDHANADERRPARTLSGGETFQASLALALALSQQIRNLAADGAPRLDAIFLDEGFGTLDPETLDVVAATIENLGQSGRMVGVVTHVSELAARVPVRFVVRKGVGTSTVEKVAP